MAPLVNLALLVPLLVPGPIALAAAPVATVGAPQELFRTLVAEHRAAVAVLASSTTADAATRLELDRAYNARMRPLVEAG
ncbi:MAG: hypothetical protein ACKO4Q_07340, partial [Planctomycetota bacterium]